MLWVMRRARWIAGWLPLLAARAADDAAIYALIDSLKPTAEAIVVDGNPADWGAIPAFPDPSGDAGAALAINNRGADAYGNPGDANFLFLAIPGNVGLRFTHMKQGTIPFAQGNPVAAGAFVGRVGNSGYSGWPHLHFGAETIPAPDPNIGIPLGITNANVGLDPTANHPWRRTVASWGIREGFFVLPEPDLAPAFAVGVAALAALAQVRALIRRRRRAASSAAPDSSPSALAGSGRSVPS